MNAIFPNILELSRDWPTAREQIKKDLERLAKTINTSWGQQHTTVGAHGDVTADSVTLQNAQVGEKITLAYDAARFTSSAGVWTVPSTSISYFFATRVGQFVTVFFAFGPTTLATATAASLIVRLPEFHILPTSGTVTTAQSYVGGVVKWDDLAAATNGMGSVHGEAFPGTPNPVSQFSLNKIGPVNATYSNFALSAQLYVRGSVTFPVQVDNLPHPYSF